MQAVDLFLKIVMNLNTDTYIYMGSYGAFVLLVPFVSTTYLAANGFFGFGGSTPYCFMSDLAPLDVDAAALYLPILVITFIGVCCMCGVFVHVCRKFKTGAAMSSIYYRR